MRYGSLSLSKTMRIETENNHKLTYETNNST